jgi:hypothetical protein
MVRRFRCRHCGEHGWIYCEEFTNVPRCLNCGQVVVVEIEGKAAPRPAQKSQQLDDAVISWLSEPPRAQEPTRAAVASCRACGFEGLMRYDSAKRDMICPACRAVYRRRPDRRQPVIDCPNCRQPIEVHETDRGKTIVCPHCNYFVGCVLSPPKRRFGSLPFLNALWGGGKS